MRRDGEIYSYDFLWKREAERGEEAGRKTRPVCLQLLTNLQRRFPDPVLLVPITSQNPTATDQALAIPEMELKRANLKGPAWVILTDVNIDADFQHSPFRAAVDPIGAFSPAFAAKVRQRILALAQSRKLKQTQRRAD